MTDFGGYPGGKGVLSPPPRWKGFPAPGEAEGKAPPGAYHPYWQKKLDKEFLAGDGADKKSARTIISPEGLPLRLNLAGRSERVASLFADYVIIFSLNILIVGLPLRLFEADYDLVTSVTLFAAFIVNNVYFIWHELTRQGVTPGKAMNKLRVINRKGGELSPYAIVARNIIRQAELFMPLLLLFGDETENPLITVALPIAWLIGITLLPLWNKDRLRMGDIIAGTMVIVTPKPVLLPELADRGKLEKPAHLFTKEQLGVYGNYELQVLEEILRKSSKGRRMKALKTVAAKIARKIDYPLPPNLDPEQCLSFLKDFYAAERRELEEGRLYGRVKTNKFTPVSKTPDARDNPPAPPGGRPPEAKK
jgi:uncharacterized RDD family membrane protein YckC